jgi:gliding motility-associated-like protein
LNKTFYILLFFLIGGAVRLSAQVNLVPNPSFELYDTCPNSFPDPGLIYSAVPWFQPDTCIMGSTRLSSSSDYFNICTSNFFSVPSNGVGYQNARTGDGYAGIFFITGYPSPSGVREYIEVKLLDTLKHNNLYYVEFYVSLANNPSGNCLATDAIHLAFSNSIIYNNCYDPLLLTPSISNPIGAVVTDTLNWVKVSGDYYAQGGELYLIIGNFFDNALSGIDSLGPAPPDRAYYYIDDVSVMDYDEEITVPNVFTPNGDGINDLFTMQETGLKEFTLKVYNRWGNEVAVINEQDLGWNGKDRNGNDCPDGNYFYIISARDYKEKENVYKGFVQLLR